MDILMVVLVRKKFRIEIKRVSLAIGFNCSTAVHINMNV